MAVSPDVIKEFLVELGYKLDEVGLRKFHGAIFEATEVVTKLGTAIVATAAAFEAAVGKMADDLEELYFASQRTGAAADNLEALRYAASQIGVGAATATASVSSLLRTLMTQPGTEGLLGQMGIQTRNANGDLKDTSEILLDLVARLKQMPFYLAAQYAQMFGISADTLQSLLQNSDEAQKRIAEYREALKRAGVDEVESTRLAHELMSELRSVWMEIGALADVVFDRLQPAAKWLLDWVQTAVRALTDLTQANSALRTELAAWVDKWLEDHPMLLRSWEALKEGMASLAEPFKALIKAWNDLDDALAEVDSQPTPAWFDKGVIDAITQSFQVLADSIQMIADALKVVTDLARGDFKKAWEDFRESAKHGVHPDQAIGGGDAGQGGGRSIWDRTMDWLGVPDPNKPAFQGAIPPAPIPLKPSGGLLGEAGSGGAPANAPAPLGVRSNNPGNIRYAGTDTERTYGTAEEGMNAMAAQLLRYYHRGLRTIEQIISRWASGDPKVPNYIASVSQMTGWAANQILNLLDPDTLSKLMAAMVRVEQGYAPYGDTMIKGAAAGQIGLLSPAPGAASNVVTLNQDTNITVSGSASPTDTADRVANNQNRVNGDLSRNLAGVLR